MNVIDDNQILQIWKNRSPKTFGGTKYDFVVEAEASIQDIIHRAKQNHNDLLRKNAEHVLHTIQQQYGNKTIFAQK